MYANKRQHGRCRHEQTKVIMHYHSLPLIINIQLNHRQLIRSRHGNSEIATWLTPKVDLFPHILCEMSLSEADINFDLSFANKVLRKFNFVASQNKVEKPFYLFVACECNFTS